MLEYLAKIKLTNASEMINVSERFLHIKLVSENYLDAKREAEKRCRYLGGERKVANYILRERAVLEFLEQIDDAEFRKIA